MSDALMNMKLDESGAKTLKCRFCFEASGNFEAHTIMIGVCAQRPSLVRLLRFFLRPKCARDTRKCARLALLRLLHLQVQLLLINACRQERPISIQLAIMKRKKKSVVCSYDEERAEEGKSLRRKKSEKQGRARFCTQSHLRAQDIKTLVHN